MDEPGRLRGLFLGALAALYVAILVGSGGLGFSERGDEWHYWRTVELFAAAPGTSIEPLRDYPEFSTPLPFVVFGALERNFAGGIAVGRAFNLLASALILLLIGWPRAPQPARGPLAALGLALCPYYIGVATHLYTDMIGMLFVLLGVVGWRRGAHITSALCFILAIASRQYAVAFPIAIAVHELVRRRSADQESTQGHVRWLAPALAAASLLGWVAFFGGVGPPSVIASHGVSTIELLRILPAHSLYFLACVGLYFVLPEVLLFARKRSLPPWLVRPGLPAIAAAVSVLLLFSLFPPLRNVDYPIESMGLFDRALRSFAGDVVRMLIYAALAVLVCLRFPFTADLRATQLSTLLVFANAALMAKAHIGWDKYALPLLVVLWWLSGQRKVPS